MARNNDRDRGTKRVPKEAIRRGKKKVCIFCADHVEWVDYKDVSLLRKFMSDRGKIRARRVSGNCAQHQRDVAVAIKLGRELALLPYTQRTTSERSGGRGRSPSGPGAGYGGQSVHNGVPTGGAVPDPEMAERLIGAGPAFDDDVLDEELS
jgi:small subunit ribosomal protein S18